MSYVYERPTSAVRRMYREQLLAEDVPIQVTEIGRSILSEPLEMYSFGQGNMRIAYIGAHHGTEWMTASLLYRFLFDLSDAYKKDAPTLGIHPHFLFSRYTFYIMPMLNTDGCALSLTDCPTPPLERRQVRMNGGQGFLTWQANARGVDLNHNYSYRHEEYKQVEKTLGIEAGRSLYSGEYPESEPETRALSSFMRSLVPEAVLSLHLGEKSIFYAPRERAACRRTAERLGRRIGCEARCPTGTAIYGGLCDYTGEVLRIPSFTLSIGEYENPPPDTVAQLLYMGLYGALYSFPTLL